jgi:hypothetical protein
VSFKRFLSDQSLDGRKFLDEDRKALLKPDWGSIQRIEISAMLGDLISGVSGAMTSLYRRVSGQPSKAAQRPLEAVKRRRRPARLSGRSSSSNASERVFLRSKKEKDAKRESLFKLEDIENGDFVGVCYWDSEPYYGICIAEL